MLGIQGVDRLSEEFFERVRGLQKTVYWALSGQMLENLLHFYFCDLCPSIAYLRASRTLGVTDQTRPYNHTQSKRTSCKPAVARKM